jgi:hypothetical protein
MHKHLGERWLITQDERYRWLDGAIGVWEGEFDS